MGYLATEIIALLGGAAVLGVVIGWALFGLGKKAAAGAPATNPKVDGDFKAERDARKKAEGRIIELESKESNFNDRLQERDAKVAELSHQLDDISKYRVQSAAELDARDQKINALEGQLRQRDADLAKAGSGAAPATVDVAERDRTIASLKAELEAARAAGSAGAGGDGARVRELERENAELRQTLIMTDGAAPTTNAEKDAAIARLNEEVTGLRAAYESAEQALEEQDAAIDKLTRDLQATQHKLTQATGDGKTAGPISVQKPRPVDTKVGPPVEPKPAPAKAEPPKVEPPKAVVNDEATVAVSLADLVGQIDQKAATTPPPVKTPSPSTSGGDPTVSMSFADLVGQVAHNKAPVPAPPPQVDSESTVAVSLEDLVGQIDQKSKAAEPKIVESKPEPMTPPPMPVAPVAPPVPPQFDSESTMALSLADLVDQIDKKAAPAVPPPSVPAAPPVPPPAPAAPPESESTMALSLDDLVAQIDAKPAGPALSFAAPEPKPAPPPVADVNESTVAVSLADLIGQIDGGSEIRLQVAPAPAGRQDDLKEIRGIGPATEKRLNSAGIMTWGQMAGLSEAELTQVADLLKISVDKIKREQWVEQARALAPNG